eukprot:scaffold1328_cov108-Cylindrotheca_fusiformis.AAC.3
MLRNVARNARHFIDGNPVHIERTLLATKYLLGDDFRIPMNPNILSSLIKAHPMLEHGSIGTIKDPHDGMQQGKGSLVILDSRQMNTGRINEFQISIGRSRWNTSITSSVAVAAATRCQCTPQSFLCIVIVVLSSGAATAGKG